MRGQHAYMGIPAESNLKFVLDRYNLNSAAIIEYIRYINLESGTKEKKVKKVFRTK